MAGSFGARIFVWHREEEARTAPDERVGKDGVRRYRIDEKVA